MLGLEPYSVEGDETKMDMNTTYMDQEVGKKIYRISDQDKVVLK